MADKKISELDQTLNLSDQADFPLSQDNGGEPTTFRAKLTQIATKIAEAITFSNLKTGNKQLVSAVNQTISNFADDFNTTAGSTYAKDDCVLYNGVLYQCINNSGTTSGTFIDADWTAIKAVDVGSGGTTDYEDLSNKPQVNSVELVGNKSLDDLGIMPASLSKTVSGSIAHITDGGDNIPVKSLVSQIVAVESGNGQPKSPNNQYTISGFNSGIVPVCGVNIWNEEWELGAFASGQLTPSTTRIRNKYPIPVKPNTTYYFKSPSIACYVMQVDKYSGWTQYDSTQVNLTFTTKPWARYIYFSPVEAYGTTYNNDISINYPSSDTQYHSYNGNNYTFAFGQDVYGGYFDNKGNLGVTHKLLEFDYQSNWRFENLLGGNFYVACGNDVKASQYGNDLSCNCSPTSNILAVTTNTCLISVAKNFNFTWGGALGITDVEDFKTYLQTNNLVIKVKCLLDNPITLSITSQDIPTILGENNIFSNCGDVEVDYFTEKSNAIAELIKAFM